MAHIFTLPVMRGLVLLAALIVWVNVYAATSHVQTLSSPVSIQNLATGLAIVDPITEVAVHISGTPHALGLVSDQTFNFAINLSNITKPGRYSAEVQVSSIPSGVKLISWKPDEIVFNVDFETTKIVPVVVNTEGWVADNYSVKNIAVVPNQVTVYGAQAALALITDVKAKISIDGRSRSFTAPVTYQVETAEGTVDHSVRITPALGKANVEIDKGASFRNLGLQATFTGELPGGFWIQEVIFEPRTMMVRGTQGKLDKLLYLSTTPINLNSKTTSFKTQVSVKLPEGVEIVGENLVLTSVNISSSEDTRQISVVPKYINVTEGFSVTNINPASVRVVVTGNPDILRQLSRSQIRLNIDLQGVLSGVNIIDLTADMFDSSEGLNVVSFEPHQIEVILSRLQ